MAITRRIRALACNIAVKAGRSIRRHVVVKGFREFVDGPERGRALVAYLVLPVAVPARFRNRITFSNRGIAQEMVRGLNEMGYVVDVINFDNTSWAPRRGYEIFIGHAGINFTELSRRLSPKTVRIYFATGMYWRDANERIAARLYGLALRRGVLLPAHRAADEAEEDANDIADGIICIGSRTVAKSYSRFSRVIALSNGVYPVEWQGWRDKDFEAGRKHFLFFAGRGNVLKGLDLVLEAFRGTDMHLHVCQHIESEFWQTYRRDCESQPNIHVYGYVQMRSAQFETLAERCNWIISATCTEGQPGAVLECMGYGLIPIVPDGVNIDVERDWALRIERCEVGTIREVAMAATGIDAEACRVMARKAADIVRMRYTAETFRQGFKDAVRAVIGDCEAARTRNGVL